MDEFAIPPERPILKSKMITVTDLQTDEERAAHMLQCLQGVVRCCTLCELGRQNCVERNTEFDPHVFSTMTISKWMVVGQNPGFNECLQHEPFVGDAGKNFNERIQRHGLTRRRFYVSNAVKCHTLGNEQPSPEQVDICSKFLQLEIAILKPTLVVTLGAVPFQAFCPALDYSSSLGKIHHSKRFDVKVFPVYHPSPRNMNDLGRRSKFYKDVETLCKLIQAFEKRNDTTSHLSSAASE
ncbi:MAG: uracil-DNA glycosylase [Candidatus Nanopelagicaceae bacterium]|nr:uracil-DNA glycosylase [Candidatus Nanopelagicaceae bacterium]